MIPFQLSEHTVQLAEIAKKHQIKTLTERVKTRVWREIEKQVLILAVSKL